MQVFGSGDATGDYEFTFSNLRAARVLTPGTQVTGTLDPGRKTELFQFNASAGDQFKFIITTPVNAGLATVNLIDPYGNYVVRDSYRTLSTVTVGQAGTYTLLVEGTVGNSAPVPYSFNLSPQGNIPPVAITGIDVGVGTNITGSISSPGGTNDYRLRISEAKRVLLDSFLDVSTVSWTLIGPNGPLADQWRLHSVDGERTSVAPFNLPPGDYLMRVRGVGANVGNYDFRLVDFASAMPLSYGVTNVFTNSPARSTTLYRFNVAAGDSLFFDQLQPPSGYSVTPHWKLFGPAGNTVWSVYQGSDIDTSRYSVPGVYTLSLEGQVYDAATAGVQTFVVRRVNDGSQSVTLGTTISGSISVGQRQVYTLSLPQHKLLAFDSMTDVSQIKWSLSGAQGVLVDRRSLNSSDGERLGNPLLDLDAGDYTFTFDGTGDLATSFQFRLVDLSSGGSIALDAPSNVSFPQSRTTQVYHLAVAEPQTVFIDLQSAAGFAATPTWSLIDPLGRTVHRSYVQDSGRLSLGIAGDYALLIEGQVYDTTANTSVAFTARRVSDRVSPLEFDTPYSGTLAIGQQQQYTFILNAPASVLFDSFVDRNEIKWSLNGPTGTIVNRWGFGSSDAERRGDPDLRLSAGTYELLISWDSDLSGDYGFRLLRFANASPIPFETVISGTNAPAKGTVLYRWDGAAGDRYFFDRVSLSGYAINPQWQLFDPFGHQVFNVAFNNVDTITLGYTGTYTLALAGQVYDSAASGSHSFAIHRVDNPEQNYVLGDTITATIAMGQTRRYNFSLAVPTLVAMDSLSDTDRINWRLEGPNGVVFNWRVIYSADSSRFNSITQLPAGAYSLLFDAADDYVGGFSFRALDLSAAAPLTVGTPTSGSVAPARTSRGYKFQAAAGDQVLLSPQGRSGFNTAPAWRLVDPFGALVFSDGSFNASSTLTLRAGGTYTLTIEGDVSDAATSGSFSFLVIPVVNASGAMPLGTLVSADLAVGQEITHAFTLNQPTLLYFDSLTDRGDLHWTLSGPAGTVVNRRAFAYSDGDRIGESALYLLSGDYRITVDGDGQASGNYKFRLLNSTNATPLTVGTPVDGVLAPVNQAAAYRFTANDGDYYQFDQQSVSGFAQSTPTWRLVNQYGQTLFRQGFSDVGPGGPGSRRPAHPLH